MKCLLTYLALIVLVIPSQALGCLENQIYIREHQVAPYSRADQTPVSGYQRNGYCRDLSLENYFQNGTTQKIKGTTFKLKKWSEAEKRIVQSHLDKLPLWLRRYRFGEVLRAETDGTRNPAATVPYTKTVILFDPFFSSKNQRDILIHEVAHIAVWDLSVRDVEEFAAVSGWSINKKKTQRFPPTNLIAADSVDSISEDFANHIEIYYANEEILKKRNPKAHEYIRKLVLQKATP
jgi:hypothetical protein